MTIKDLPKHLTDGKAAEQLAATFLHQNGLTLVEQNFRCPYGEIDLIMRDDDTLVFVEVRLRGNNHFGGAAMSITRSKQEKLSRAAARYLQTHGNTKCRFDVVLMHKIDIATIEWIKNAF